MLFIAQVHIGEIMVIAGVSVGATGFVSLPDLSSELTVLSTKPC